MVGEFLDIVFVFIVFVSLFLTSCREDSRTMHEDCYTSEATGDTSRPTMTSNSHDRSESTTTTMTSTTGATEAEAIAGAKAARRMSQPRK